ncbi:unnamed protein product [Rotaria sp. Silwood1]|nr:unnamed protein product [Rotaria sp. Silwood1]CAF1360761.1 unnamed protein product [Rotaria sp. Silwood1]CAF3543673.1 unnamed protein product [Rotaria sp. Silwood1]CAF3596277.1 unnamed protein product [Rotaria sp. Silwood1]CAF4668924.1 unnamed protein product [Rotaria sp. Silwood1]
MNRFSDIDLSFKRLPPVYGYRSEKLVPIEKALEPIQSQIDELPYYIKIAKQYCHFPSEHELSHDESAAVYIYTMEWGETSLYRVLNNALRSENRQALKIWFPYLKLFDTALEKLPTVKEAVWRGVPIDIGKNFSKDQILTWWTVNSCSSSVNIIERFLGDDKNATLFLIEAINGKKISGYTEHESEDEVILRMGSKFRVKSDALKHSNGSHLVHLLEIDDVPPPPPPPKSSLPCGGRACPVCDRCIDWDYDASRTLRYQLVPDATCTYRHFDAHIVADFLFFGSAGFCHHLCTCKSYK